MKKLLLRLLAALAVFLLLIVGYIQFFWNKKHDVAFPDIKAVQDSAVIARGKYLAYGPAHCGTCHMPMDKIEAVEGGEIYPLSGGWSLTIPPGTFRAPNLTPDKETGIGNRTDGELARAMRHMVKHDGSTLFPFMPFQGLSDEDLTAVISFLRSQEPVKHEVKPTELSFLGKALSAFGVVQPEGPKSTPPRAVPRDTTAVYGEYIARHVANCVGCHTERDLKTGAFIGEEFAGGFYMPADEFSKGYSFVSPNLTPDPETGLITSWDQATFVTRFHKGRVHAGSPMPWGAFSRMDDVEIIALYKFLHALPPVSRKIEKIVFQPGETYTPAK